MAFTQCAICDSISQCRVNVRSIIVFLDTESVCIEHSWNCDVGEYLSRARHQPGGHVTSRPGGGAVLKEVQLNVVEFHTESCVVMSAECWTVIRVCEAVHSTELLMLSRHELVFAALCL